MNEVRVYDVLGITADFDADWDCVTIATGVGRVCLPVSMVREIVAAAEKAKSPAPILTAVNA